MRKKSPYTGSVLNGISFSVNLATGFILTPLIISETGTSLFGEWSLIIMIIGYYGFFDLGVTNASLRYMAKFIGEKDNKKLTVIFNTSFIIFFSAGFLLLVLSFLLAEHLAVLFNSGVTNPKIFSEIFFILGITTAVIFPSRIFSALLMAGEQWISINLIRVITTILRGILSVIILKMNYGIKGLAIVNALIEIISFLLNLIISTDCTLWTCSIYTL